ncbi:MAG TPA: serine hydrolase [Mycobacteriales bacterium]|nr:serine hydrolase [Mycobacteriales bacterium]
MRIPTTLLAGALACLAIAPAASAESAVVGGSELATRGVVVGAGAPALPRTAAAGWLVADLDTGEVLAARDPHGRYAPASTLKVLTAETLIGRLNPTTMVRPTWDDVNVEGSRVGIVQKMRYSVKDLLTAMLVVSGNDAANALATANGGLAKTVGGDRLASHGLVVSSGAPTLPLTAAAGWLVADLDTGEVLAARDPHGRYAPASTLKVLTAETLIGQLDPTTMVQPTWEDVNVEGSRVGIVQKMRYSVKDLFTAMLVVSGNDAANALATANGGLPKTVAEMNAEARRLNALDTRAANANGLDNPKQRSSPYDLALIGREAMRSSVFRGYVATKRYYMPAPGRKTIYLASHDKLLWNYDGAIGIKNGYTVKARATFVGAATRGGHTLIVTLMRTNPRYWPEAAALLNWGFKAKAAGTAPVGTLVEANPVGDSTSGLSDKAATYVAPQAVRTTSREPTTSSAGVPVLPVLLVGSGAAVVGGGLMRTRTRRRPRKLKLPPI